MSVPAWSPAGALLLLAVVGAVIIALHRLRLPALRVALPSTQVWMRALMHAPRLRQPWRRWLALLLALAIGWLIALALAGPGTLIGTAGQQHTVIVLDNSSSMAARTLDGSTRWAHARARAAALIDALPDGNVVALLDSTGRTVPSGFLSRREAHAALAGMQVSDWGRAQWPSLPTPERARVHVITDGVALAGEPPAAIVHSVFEPADNVAITAFDVRPLPHSPTRLEALVQVLNASPARKRVQVLLRGGDYRFDQTLDLDADESADLTIDVSAFRGGVLAAAAALEGDAFPADDIAYAYVPPHAPLRVLLVGPGNASLQDALRSLPGIELNVRTPRAYRPDERFDAVVFDRYGPAFAPRTPAMLMRPPALPWLAMSVAPVMGDRTLQRSDAHPATEGVLWSALPMTALWSVAAHGNDAVVLRTRTGTAVATVADTPVRTLVLGFAWNDAPLSLQASLPVFLGNALRWLTQAVEIVRAEPGMIELPVSQAHVHAASAGETVSYAGAASTVFEAARPDVYQVSANGRVLQVVVQPRDPHAARINFSRFGARSGSAPPYAAASMLPALWASLLLIAGALLVAEWLLHARRITA